MERLHERAIPVAPARSTRRRLRSSAFSALHSVSPPPPPDPRLSLLPAKLEDLQFQAPRLWSMCGACSSRPACYCQSRSLAGRQLPADVPRQLRQPRVDLRPEHPDAEGHAVHPGLRPHHRRHQDGRLVAVPRQHLQCVFRVMALQTKGIACQSARVPHVSCVGSNRVVTAASASKQKAVSHRRLVLSFCVLSTFLFAQRSFTSLRPLNPERRKLAAVSQQDTLR